MSLTNLITKTRRLLTQFFREQAEMSVQVGLFLESIPWRDKP